MGNLDCMCSCCFCDIISRSSKNEYDKVIYETNSFLVITSLGAFVEGYLLVIPKNHISSMSKLNDIQIEELKLLKVKILQIYKKYYNASAIIFENGSSSEKGLFKDSIVHAHLHFVPSQKNEDYSNKIFGNIGCERLKDYSEIKNYINESYIFYEYDKNNLYISKERTKFIRQHSRKILASEIKGAEYNWKKEGYIDKCLSTIEKFSEYFKNI